MFPDLLVLLFLDQFLGVLAHRLNIFVFKKLLLIIRVVSAKSGKGSFNIPFLSN